MVIFHSYVSLPEGISGKKGSAPPWISWLLKPECSGDLVLVIGATSKRVAVRSFGHRRSPRDLLDHPSEYPVEKNDLNKTMRIFLGL